LATGKSTVAGLLAERGIPVFDADAAVHELYLPGAAGAKAAAGLFGREVLDAAGGVDREALAARILGDERARQLLEEAVHPLVRRAIADWRNTLVGEDLAVVEAALLVETGSYKDYDLLVVVWCTPEQQLDHALTRGVATERARGLIEAQLPLERKTELADVEIDNRGGRDELIAKVATAVGEIRRLCAERERGSKGAGQEVKS